MKLVALGDLVLDIKTWNPQRDGKNLSFDYIDISSVNQESKQIGEWKRIQSSEAPSRARQLVSSEDVLVSTVRPNLNSVAQVPVSLDGATASTGFCVLRANAASLDSRYLFHWVRSPQFVEDMTMKATGASYPAVSDGIIRDSKIPFPPLLEQRRIAAILDKADALREKRRQAIAKLDALLKSVFIEMFGDPVTNPKGWKIIKVGEAGRVQLGRQRAPQYQSGKFSRLYVRVANVFEDRIDITDVLKMDFDENDFKQYRLQFGDILLNEGQSTELVGRPAMWRDEIKDCCFQNTLVRFQANEHLTNPDYALALFLNYFRTGQFAKISSKTSNVAPLGAGRFAAMPFLLPPQALQDDFSRKWGKLRKLKAASRSSLLQLEQLFQSLQQRAFSGELFTEKAVSVPLVTEVSQHV